MQLNWVEAVVLLPAGILTDSNIEMSLLILNKAKAKDTIRMVDARSFGERQRRKLHLSLDDAAINNSFKYYFVQLQRIQTPSC